MVHGHLPNTTTQGSRRVVFSVLRAWARAIYPELTPDVPLVVTVGMGDMSSCGESHDLNGPFATMADAILVIQETKRQLQLVTADNERLRDELQRIESKRNQKNASQPRPSTQTPDYRQK
jgi:hypothetical protein